MNIDFLHQGAHASAMTHNSVVRLLLQSRRHVATCHVLNYKGFFRPGGPELLRKASSAGCLRSQGSRAKGTCCHSPTPPPRCLQEQCKLQQPRYNGRHRKLCRLAGPSKRTNPADWVNTVGKENSVEGNSRPLKAKNSQKTRVPMPLCCARTMRGQNGAKPCCTHHVAQHPATTAATLPWHTVQPISHSTGTQAVHVLL